VGIAVSDVIAEMRESGLAVSQELRGIERERCLILPIPLNRLDRMLSRSQAKRQLGIPEDAIVLLSIACAYKYEPILEETSFVDALLPVLARHEKAVLLVVGPDGRGQWERGIRESGGRIKAYGTRGDIAIFYQAADIYLDAFPVASLTSLLEAGSYGVPLVAFSPFVEKAGVLCADCPGFSDTLVRARDLETYRAEITTLIENSEARSQLGELTKRAILNTHVGKCWMEYLERIYSFAATVSSADIRPDGADVPNVKCLDILLAYISAHTGNSPEVDEIFRYGAGLLPLPQRLKLWACRFHWRPDLLPRFLLSEWARSNAKKWVSGKRCRVTR
jgi:hypothetical protein